MKRHLGAGALVAVVLAYPFIDRALELHTVHAVSANEWTHPYARERAAFPAPYLRDHKFWPAVGRIDNPYGDRNLVCVCPPMSEYGG